MSIEIQSTVELTPKERETIVKRANGFDANIVLVRLSPDGYHLDCEFRRRNPNFCQRPFERIRRITGYLVGTLDRWNSAKQAEEHDRVKHGGIIPDNSAMMKDGKTRCETIDPFPRKV